MTAVVSGEGVAFDLPRAGLGSRIVATVVDLALQFVALLVLVLIDASVGGGADDAAITAVVIVELVLVLAGYPILCEWLTRGRTVGKAWLGLRVVRDDGGPIGFRPALVRGLASLVLEKPGVALGGLGAALGLIVAGCSARDKRIGDLLAGTFVLNERAGTSRRPELPQWGVPPWLQPWAAALDLTRLDDRLALSVRQFVTRAPTMTPAAQDALGAQLRHAVLAVVAPPPPPNTPTPDVLIAVLAERRRRAFAASAWMPPPASPPPPPPPPARPGPPPGPFAPPG
jgi:uncharacterized RDD family membrane protein YckC